MAVACRHILEFRADASFEAFSADLQLRSAIIHQLMIVGEAAKRVSSEYSRKHPQIPWRAIAGMRDRLIHAYDAVDLDEVWLAVERDVPRMLQDLEPLLPRRG
ncbi:MAG TPA: HepT-like ribonuclease domain-containing protein [Candidatus Thermoplasmatota archaeon]|nr:HepT-like ribonuclease domain-containing protein [Candidatus Thermoplasmatota archaeon]